MGEKEEGKIKKEGDKRKEQQKGVEKSSDHFGKAVTLEIIKSDRLLTGGYQTVLCFTTYTMWSSALA